MSNAGPTEVVDWDAAEDFAFHMMPPGPKAERSELVALVSGLRQAAADAVDPVLNTTRLEPVGGLAAMGTTHVVDRITWAKANLEVMAATTANVGDTLAAAGETSTLAGRLGAAAEMAGVLTMLAPRVLGQFDPYSADPGRLLLVAPNVLATERKFGVNPIDFRLWVCLHEQTHALQFASTPWLAPHLLSQITSLLDAVTARAVELAGANWFTQMRAAMKTVRSLVAGALSSEGPAPFERLLGHEQRDLLSKITATMSLVEGHADVIMDDVGPEVVPSVAQIRAKFERRRSGEGAPRSDVILRRLMGMESKLSQYRDGAKFVREVEEKVGRDGFNAIWAGADMLPTAVEIADPAAWVKRVHG